MGTFSNRISGVRGIAMVLVAMAALGSRLTMGSAFVTQEAQEAAADYCRQAQKLLQDGNSLQAREAARHALDIDPRSAEAECLLGMAEWGLGDADAAEKDLSKALELKPGLIAAQRTLGAIYLKQKQLKDARRQFASVLASHPNDFESLYGVGLTFLLDNQPAAALGPFHQAAKIQPQNPGLLASLLQTQLQLKQETAAAATLAQLDSQFGKEDPKRRELAAMLAGEGAYKLAVQQFERLRDTQPESYELNYNLALAYHLAGQEDQAAALLAHMLGGKEIAELENLLGDVEEARGNKSQSVEAFRRAAELEPQNVEYRYDYAEALAHEWLLNQALQAFQRAADDFPQSALIWMGWGATYYLAGNYPAAAQTLLHTAEIAPRSGEVYYLLGRAYDAAGPLQNAIAERFAEHCSAEPGDVWGHYFYGHILAASSPPPSAAKLREAQEHLEKAVALNNNLAEAHTELGKVLEMRGQIEAARKELERAVQLDPQSSAAYYRLGIVYRKAGEPELAQQALAKFQQLKAKERKDLDREQIQGFLERARQDPREP
jgi:tetratricopeptide (TPR) repeat protein